MIPPPQDPWCPFLLDAEPGGAIFYSEMFLVGQEFWGVCCVLKSSVINGSVLTEDREYSR
jgi:hypothetical protein